MRKAAERNTLIQCSLNGIGKVGKVLIKIKCFFIVSRIRRHTKTGCPADICRMLKGRDRSHAYVKAFIGIIGKRPAAVNYHGNLSVHQHGGGI